jgi:sortase (surface protein transpeptidase)
VNGKDGRVDPERNDQPIRFIPYEPPFDPLPNPQLKKGDKVRIITSEGVGEYEVTGVQAVDGEHPEIRVSFDPR